MKTNSLADPSLKVAIKIMNKEAYQIDLEYLDDEIAILNSLDHPNIVKYMEKYEDKEDVCLVMECIEGESLEEKLERDKMLPEMIVRMYMRQLFEAINHCHAQYIVHRDIKPENIMICGDNTVKLIDFGLAEWASGEIEHFAGSPFFYAPETIENKSVAQSDIWSLTVCMYKMLTGVSPFDADDKEELFALISSGKYPTESESFKALSVQCRDLFSKLLVVDPNARLTGITALQHPWFKPVLPSLPSVSMKIV